MEESYSIKIPVFEGPLDLLLHLIRENKLDIYDIPISVITHQYLEYIEMMKDLNLDVAGEFLVMAATLIQIKSRMLLPVTEEAEEEQQEDPRLELVQRLLEYQAFKDASLGLREREDAWSGHFSREAAEEEPKPAIDEESLFAGLDTGEGGSGDDISLELFDLSIFDLLSAFRKLVEKAPPDVIMISREALSVKDRIAFIMEKLETKEAIRFEELFEGGRTRAHLIVTFIALLEILRLGLARGYQEKDFGHVWIISRQEQLPRQPDVPAGEPDDSSQTPPVA